MKTSFTALAAAAFVAVAGSAAVASPVILQGDASDTSYVELGLVRADAATTVEIYDYHAGEKGELLGSAPIHAGANQNVKVRLGETPSNDVIAVLSDGTAQKVIREDGHF